MEADLAAIKNIPLLKTLSEDELRAMIPFLELVKYGKNEIVFKQTEKGDALYLIIDGKVKFTYLHITGQIDIFEEIGAGKFFGEVGALSSERLRTATAEVTQDLTAYKLKRKDLENFLKSHPEAAMHLLNGMADRLRRSGRQLQHSPVINFNKTMSESLTARDKTAKWVAQFAGSVPFLILHVFVYTIWIVVGGLQGEKGFDPYPFHLLALVIGIEALVLSCFVLMNQFREDKAADKRNDHEYQVNVAANQKADALHTKLDDLSNQLLKSPAERETTVVSTDLTNVP